MISLRMALIFWTMSYSRLLPPSEASARYVSVTKTRKGPNYCIPRLILGFLLVGIKLYRGQPSKPVTSTSGRVCVHISEVLLMS